MRTINPDDLPPPRGFSNGVAMPARGTLLFIAGQIGAGRDGRVTSDRFTDQFDRAIANVVRLVAEAGGSPAAVGKLTIFVTDKAEYLAERRAVGEAYRRHMGRHYPAMSLVEVRGLVDPGAKVEIEGIAVIDREAAGGTEP
jgi:enamine deaminase RidA (YjgF/YER057c/UK114 family)